MWSRHLSIPNTDSVLWGDYTGIAVSNGIDLEKYKKGWKKEEVFRKTFLISEKVKGCGSFYFKHKGIEDFIKVARRMPDIALFWPSSINKWIIPRRFVIVEKDHQ